MLINALFCRRPMRSSKSKAMDQVKQWCGSMKDEDNDCKYCLNDSLALFISEIFKILKEIILNAMK